MRINYEESFFSDTLFLQLIKAVIAPIKTFFFFCDERETKKKDIPLCILSVNSKKNFFVFIKTQ